jgi:hypothetical protein
VFAVSCTFLAHGYLTGEPETDRIHDVLMHEAEREAGLRILLTILDLANHS